MSATKPPAPPSTRRQPRWGAWDLDTIESIEATTGHSGSPILDKTCWYCGGPFETRDPQQELCPPCERLRDADTRATSHSTPADLPCATTMPPAELDRQCKVYAARFISGEPFSPEERAHWADCEEAHQEYVEARTWTITRRQ